MPSLVIIETPWAELGAGEHARNYFRNAMRDALTNSNEIPWSRQALFYNGVLDFSDFEQVAESYELAQKAITCCDTMILYVDKGESRAMKNLANFAITQRKPSFVAPSTTQQKEQSMRKVVLESPYAGDKDLNVAYARRCIRDSLLRDEAPIASHLLYTQPSILDDDEPSERIWGIKAGQAWINIADALVVYTDLGVSIGMKSSITIAKRLSVPIEYREIGLTKPLSRSPSASIECAVERELGEKC